MKKEQLSSIFKRHALIVVGLAEAADVAPSVVTDMLKGIPVGSGLATHVLAALSRLTQIHYSLDNVEIATKPETPFQSEIARMLEEIDEQTDAMMRASLVLRKRQAVTR